MNKSEKKKIKALEAELQQKQAREQEKLKKLCLIVAAALIICGAGLMFFSAVYYEAAPNLYHLLQNICYLLVCLGGVALALTAKYESNGQAKTRYQVMGLVFIVISAGRLVINFIGALV